MLLDFRWERGHSSGVAGQFFECDPGIPGYAACEQLQAPMLLHRLPPFRVCIHKLFNLFEAHHVRV
jgi:hypothetical protein